jgi:hypothetical protein
MSTGKPAGPSSASSSSAASSSAALLSSSTTYEANKALQSTQRFADKIHWDSSITFRDSPYRQLHHQRGLIGSFRVRLLEGSNLRRSYWSALALGPVKHLGLSKAYGAVSSYCCFDLEFQPPDGEDDIMNRHHVRFQGGHDDSSNAMKKPAAKRSASSSNNKKSGYTSPVVPANDHPVWDNCQCECPLWKGSMPEDGQRIRLAIRVYEDATALENLLPGVPSSSDEARLLGIGAVDLTELCLGETVTGQALPGIVDAWVNLTLPDQQQQAQQEMWEDRANHTDPMAMVNLKKPPAGEDGSGGSSSNNKSTGMVRVLVSYQPHGLEPQPNDVVALEAFARRNPSTSSCRPLLPPLMPLIVKERQGPYLLVEYPLLDAGGYGSSRAVTSNKACCRLHRNAVFVIERKNLVDAAHNLALLPIDVVVSTPIGQAAIQFANPVVMASRELLMPIMLSLKLVWVAARTTTLAGLSGFQALGQTFWNEGTGSLTGRHEREHHHHLHHHDRATATAQFVSL